MGRVQRLGHWWCFCSITCTLLLRARAALGRQLAPLPTDCGNLFDDKHTPLRLNRSEDLLALLTIAL